MEMFVGNVMPVGVEVTPVDVRVAVPDVVLNRAVLVLGVLVLGVTPLGFEDKFKVQGKVTAGWVVMAIATGLPSMLQAFVYVL